MEEWKLDTMWLAVGGPIESDAQVRIMVKLMHVQTEGLVFGDHNPLQLMNLVFLAGTRADPG